MKKISIDSLTELLYSQKGATFATILARTMVDLVGGKSCPLAGLQKLALTNGVINFSYANAVNNQRARENNTEYFEPEPRRWGIRLLDGKRLTPLVLNPKTNEKYLEMKVERSLKYAYYDTAGCHVRKSVVAKYLRQRKESETQKLDKEIILRDYKLSGIVAIRLNGQIYGVSKRTPYKTPTARRSLVTA